MASIIKPRRGTSAPTTGEINQNELAVDTTNKRIYIGAADGSGTLIGSAPAGSDTQVQFNDGGVLGGDSGLVYNKSTDTLTVGSLVSTGGISVNGTVAFTFEGAIEDANEVFLLVTEPTADRYLVLPDANGTLATTALHLGSFGATTSAQLAGVISDETGSGSLVFASSPTLTTPNIGVASGTSLTLTGDAAINGGDITTTSTGTATVFNTNATTLNMGGAATQINIGASSGDVDIAGALQTVDEVVVGSVLGVNKTDPQYAADVNSASGACLRLIYNSSSGTPTNYVNFAVSSSGDLTLTPSGGDVSMNANMGMNDKTLSRVEFLDYFERLTTPNINAKNSTLTLDLSLSQVFSVSLNNAITTLTISNVPDNGNANAVGFTLILVADGTARSVTWPANVKWPANTPPTLTSTNAKADIFSFISTDGGSNWYAFVGGQNF